MGLFDIFGGGNDGSAQVAAANRAEEKRKRDIQKAINEINKIFSTGRGSAPKFGTVNVGGGVNPVKSRAKAIQLLDQHLKALGAEKNQQPSGQPGAQFAPTVSQVQQYANSNEVPLQDAARMMGVTLDNTTGQPVVVPAGSVPGKLTDRQISMLDKALAKHDTKRDKWNDQKAKTPKQIYDDHRLNVKKLGFTELKRQNKDAERNLRFNLARSGLIGGSADADGYGELKRLLGEGKVKVRQNANTSAETLRQADERTRMGLIAQAQAGMKIGDASSAALRQLSQNSSLASAQNMQANLGDLFSSLKTKFNQNRYNAGFNNSAYGNRHSSVSRVSSPGTAYQGD